MNRRTEMFSPSLAMASATTCRTVLPGSLMKSCSRRQTSAANLLDLALDDLVDDLRRLPGLRRLRRVDLALALELGRPGSPRGSRSSGRAAATCIARLAHELLEVVGARDEIGLAVHLDQDADLAAGVDVRADHTLGGGAAGLLGSRGEAALAQIATAPSRSPSLSASAFLQSMNPAPVFSRSSFTCCALTSLMPISPPADSSIAVACSSTAGRLGLVLVPPCAALALFVRARGLR